MKVFKQIASPKYWFLLTILSLFIISCEEDRDLDFINNLEAPSNIQIAISVSQDNTGTVTISPTGDNASSFVIDFGDGSEPEEIIIGESAIHVYSEGAYTVSATAKNISGDTAVGTQDFSISFLPPENLEITITQVVGDSFSINLSAQADLVAGFEAYFGEFPDADPVPFGVGESITYTYSSVGTYEVRVVALSGGSQTIEVTETVTIVDPLVLPIDFESTTIEYTFLDFGGATTTVIDNPDPSGANTSTRVAQFFKEEGAETFAGTVLDVGAPIDFSNFTSFQIDVWSPLPNSTVLFKIENATDPNINIEIERQTSTSNSWETMVFDFSGGDLTQEYSKIVLFFDFGNTGNGDTFYFDTISQESGGSGGSDPVTLPVDFENPDLEYVIIGFEGADSAIEANPDMSGANTSNTVVRTTKTVGAQFFAGTIVELDEPIDFSSTEKIAIKTWSPKLDIPIRVKLENSDGSQFVELDVNTTTSNAWEELVWDFTGLTSGSSFTKVVIFFEFDDTTTGDGSTYYFDDIELTN